MTAQQVPEFVLFDWNGTLMDDMERARKASSLVRQRWAGLPELTLDEFRRAWCLPLSDHARRLEVPEDCTDEAARAWSTYLGELDAPLSTGAIETIGALGQAGIKLAVVSAATDSAVRRDLSAHGLEQHFDGIHCQVLQEHAMLESYVHRAGADAVWYVGDTTFDVVQARKAGAIAIGYTGGYDTADALRDAGAHRLIDRLSDLISLIADTNPDHP